MPWLDEAAPVAKPTGRWLDEPKKPGFTPEEKEKFFYKDFPEQPKADKNLGQYRQQLGHEPTAVVDANQRPGITPNLFNSFLKLPRYETPVKPATGRWLDEEPHSKTDQVTGGLYNVAAGLMEAVTSPAGLPTTLLAPGMAGPAGKALVGLGAAAYGAHALPEQVVDAYGAFKLDAPLSEKVQKPVEAGLTALMTGLGAVGIAAPFRAKPGSALVPRGPDAGAPPAGMPPRQIGPEPILDAEIVVPKPILPASVPTPVPTTGRMVPSERPTGPARFIQDNIGNQRDMSQLTVPEQAAAVRGLAPYTPRETQVRPAAPPIPILGTNPEAGLIKRIDIEPTSQELVLATEPTKLPIVPSGGEVSYRAPAAAEAVPSARQAALPQQIGPGAPAKAGNPPSAQRLYSLQGLMFDPQLYRDIGRFGVQAGRSAVELGHMYSEPIAERLGRLGGPVGQQFSREATRSVTQAKGYYGELTPSLNPAKRAVGSVRAPKWLRETTNVTPRAAISNFMAALDGAVQVPAEARPIMALGRRANQDIRILEARGATTAATPNRARRIFTPYQVDVFRRGGGPAREAWVEGTAAANNQPRAAAAAMADRFKALYDSPGFDAVAFDNLMADFEQKFPRAITHIKPGLAWHEVLVADPFNYLEQAAQRAAQGAAFREVFPPGSGLFSATRRNVQRELQTDTHGHEFDMLVRALQGHPIDTHTNWAQAPDSPVGAVTKMTGTMVGQPLRALMLSANSIVNAAETIAGGPAIFLGFGKAFRAMAQRGVLLDQLRLSGALNEALQNSAFDPKAPGRSVARMVSNAIRTGTFQQFFNELQEFTGAAAARLLADDIRAGRLSRFAQQEAIAAMRAMGFTEPQARAAVERADPELLTQFERSAAARLTAGNQASADKSQLGNNRTFRSLFWFHDYSMTVIRQFGRVFSNIFESARAGNWKQVGHSAKLLAKMIAVRGLQGAIYTGLVALVNEWTTGLKERVQEAMNEPFKFAASTVTASIGGPLYFAKKIAENSGDANKLITGAATLSAPVSVGMELYNMAAEAGRYEGMPVAERIGAFVASKTPASKAFKTGMALAGLSNEDRTLMVAKKAFGRYAVSKGWNRGPSDADEETAAFRYQMRQAVRKLENGEDWRSAFPGDVKDVARSLYQRTTLKKKNNKPLSDEELAGLREHIGTELVEKLQNRDAMIRQLARELGDTKDIQKVNQPTGKFALDTETQSKRAEDTFKALAPDVQSFLQRNGITELGFTPDVKYGKEASKPLTVPESEAMQAEFVNSLNRFLTPLVKEKGWDRRPQASKDAALRAKIDAARSRAKAVARREASR